MAKKFKDLVARMPLESQERAHARSRAILASMPLQELRRARSLSQRTLADTLGASQAAISKLERRADMYVSTLRRYIEGMGGELDITARFPDGSVEISQFHDIEDLEPHGELAV
ncbi:MAG: transcriptional regulator [Gemmatimonadetes bacterium]|nr:transcriptional regulator [Gemmatimonadota bacterium]